MGTPEEASRRLVTLAPQERDLEPRSPEQSLLVHNEVSFDAFFQDLAERGLNCFLHLHSRGNPGSQLIAATAIGRVEEIYTDGKFPPETDGITEWQLYRYQLQGATYVAHIKQPPTEPYAGNPDPMINRPQVIIISKQRAVNIRRRFKSTPGLENVELSCSVIS